MAHPRARRPAAACRAHRRRAPRARLFGAAHRRAARAPRDMTIAYAVVDGVATIALDRPEVRNALNLEMCEALLAVTRRIIEENVRVVFVRGNGPVFCGGADLKERQAQRAPGIRERALNALGAA